MDTKPIIARFFTRNIRSLVFRLKTKFAPKEQPAGEPTTKHINPRQKDPIYDDLTKANFTKMHSPWRQIRECWPAGQLKDR